MAEQGSDKIKVVMAPLPQPNWGGLHAVIEAVAPHVRRAGYEIRPVVPTGAPEILQRFIDAGVTAAEVRQSRLRRSANPADHVRFLAGLVTDSRALVAMARQWDASLVQAAGLHCVQGPIAARQADMALVWQIHSDFLPPAARRFLTPLATRMSDVIMVNGSRVRAAFPLVERLPDDRIFEFRAPINAARFEFSQVERQSARERLGLAPDAVAIGTIGARAYQKAHERLVELAHRLDEDDRVRTVIIGGEIAAQTKAYARLVHEPADRAGLTQRSKIKWINAGSQVRDYLPALDIFVMPSRAEGIPVAMLEAMASGLPVVASDVGSISEVIQSGANGFLVRSEPFDSTGFADTVRRLVNDADLRAKLGAKAQETARRDFSAESVAEAHVRAYERALKVRTANRAPEDSMASGACR